MQNYRADKLETEKFLIQEKYFLLKVWNVILLICTVSVNCLLYIKDFTTISQIFYVLVLIPFGLYLLCQIAEYNQNEKLELMILEESFTK